MLWPRNGLGLPMISPVIERDVRRRFSPSTVAEPGVPGLEFGVFEFVWYLKFERCGMTVIRNLKQLALASARDSRRQTLRPGPPSGSTRA
jgi:hypothetical protein